MQMISNLSDDLLLKILSSLPTKNVVATMLLSKRWRYLWTMLPKLDFDYGSKLIKPSEYEKFVKYVDRSLVLNRTPFLETLKFKVGPCCSSEDLATWIRMGMVRVVRELEISDCADDDDSSIILLPKTLYLYEKLEVLKLAYVMVEDVPVDFCFPSLKSLHLACVLYRTEESYCKLFSSCPVLEELVLDITENCFCMTFSVEIPTLQRLSIRDTFNPPNDGDDDHKIVINVPSLKYLNFVDLYDNLCLFENMPEVVEANVNVVHENPEKLLESLPSVKRLSLCLSASVLQHRIGFCHLLHLELCVDAPGWWDLLTWMLESSPKLQVLKLCSCKEHSCTIHSDPSMEGRWRGPSSDSECLMFHLHTFKWKNYNGKDKEIVAYILKNARQLKTAGFSWRWCTKEEQSRRLSELVSLPRASSSCQLILD